MKFHFRQTSVSLSLACFLCLGIASPQPASGCASCGCSLSSDWESQGYSTDPGLKADLLFNYIDQDQLRHGTSAISASQVPPGTELERFTKTGIITFGLDYDFNPDWNASLLLPYVIRDHATMGNDHESPDSTGTSSIGDTSLIVRYQGILPLHNLGVELGFKLPTGAFNDPFRSGPENILDRGLQPGTGTTDAIAGIYYYDKFSPALGHALNGMPYWGYFATATVQTALDSRDQYRPGTAENITLGVRYTGIEHIVPQFQVNTRIVNRDSGAQADVADTGGVLLYLSPGVTFELTKKVSTFVFVQVPVFQNVNGYQLAPTWTLSVGMRVVF